MRRLAALMAVAAGVAACSSGGGDDRGLEGLDTPQFAPDDDFDGTTSTTASATADTAATTSIDAPAAADPGAPSTTPAPDPNTPAGPDREVVSFDDPVGDAVGGLDQDPPDWADLAGGSLERQRNAYQLIVRLGDQAPESQPGVATMNVAAFFDVDGDGSIDHELWVNLGEGGWGPVWYEGDRAHPGESSNVTVVVDGDELRLLFPDVMLDAPERLRFSLASEYGELSVIGSSYAHRDDAPDGDQAVSFPN